VGKTEVLGEKYVAVLLTHCKSHVTGLESNPNIDGGRQMCVEGDKFRGRHGRRATICEMSVDVNASVHATTC
jgi:hypothetical protein